MLGSGGWQVRTIRLRMDKQRGPTDSAGNYIQHTVITCNEKNIKKECIYVKLSHFAVYQRLAQHC